VKVCFSIVLAILLGCSNPILVEQPSKNINVEMNIYFPFNLRSPHKLVVVDVCGEYQILDEYAILYVVDEHCNIIKDVYPNIVEKTQNKTSYSFLIKSISVPFLYFETKYVSNGDTLKVIYGCKRKVSKFN
jgi:hypothetical protein